jgi:PadR family transcriptional regulator, regulatory protein PadR
MERVMVTEPETGAEAREAAARFGLAPPRRFLLPAILLLLSEHPGYGYGLVGRLRELQLGHVDRPAVYRALAALKQDGLVEATEPSHSGQARRVYAVTPLGERVLRVWMGVVREEHAHLGEVIRRYQATGRMDAVLSEVEGGWLPDIEMAWSSVSTTSLWRRRLIPLDDGTPEATERAHPFGDLTALGDGSSPDRASSPPSPEAAAPRNFAIDAERSAVLIDVRSTVGPISFGSTGVEGSFSASVLDGVVNAEPAPSGWLAVDVKALTSGNKLYDAELHRRVNSRRFPTARVELRDCTASTPGSRFQLRGELNFHGVTRKTEGTVYVESLAEDRLVISGEQVFDMRDFAVPSPTVLMLRIFPDVRVRLHAEAELTDA